MRELGGSWVDQPAEQLFGQRGSEAILLGSEANEQVDFLERKRQDEVVQLAQTSSTQRSAAAELGSEGVSSRETDKQSQATTVESTVKSDSKFFYIDDFFYWLGCKFVTCDKPKPGDGQNNGDKEQEKSTQTNMPRKYMLNLTSTETFRSVPHQKSSPCIIPLIFKALVSIYPKFVSLHDLGTVFVSLKLSFDRLPRL